MGRTIGCTNNKVPRTVHACNPSNVCVCVLYVVYVHMYMYGVEGVYGVYGVHVLCRVYLCVCVLYSVSLSAVASP